MQNPPEKKKECKKQKTNNKKGGGEESLYKEVGGFCQKVWKIFGKKQMEDGQSEGKKKMRKGKNAGLDRGTGGEVSVPKGEGGGKRHDQ